MILKRLTLRGAIGIKTGLDQEEITVDFRQFGPGLIVLVGPNGAGKTTLIENLTPYRSLRSRPGSLARQFYLKDSYRDLLIDMNGDEYRFRLNINGESAAGKVESIVYKNGAPLNEDGLEASYNEIVFKLFGPPDMFFSSLFMPQHRVPFSALKPGDAKTFMLDVIGAGRVQKKCDHAKAESDRVAKLVTATQGELTILEGLLADCGNPDEMIKRVSDAIAEIESRQAVLAAEMISLVDVIDALQAKATGQAITADRLKATEDRRAKTITEGTNAKREFTEATRKIVEAIEADEKAAADLTILVTPARLESINGRIADAEKARVAYEETIAGRQQYDQAKTHLAEIQTKYATAKAEYGRKGQELVDSVAKAQNALDTARHKYETAKRQLDANIERAKQDASILPTVPCQQLDEATAAACATCQFITNAVAARTGLEGLEADLGTLTAAWEVDKNHLEASVGTASEARDNYLPFDSTPEGLAIIAEGSAARETLFDISFDPKVADGIKANYDAFLADDPKVANQAFETRKAKLDALTERLEINRTAKAELESKWADNSMAFDLAIEGLNAEIAELTAGVDTTVAGRLASAKAALEKGRETEHDLAAMANRNRFDLQALGLQKIKAEETTAKVADKRGHLAKLQAELADWDDLNISLGRTSGFQSMLVENAGAQMTPRANELLALYERPWTVEISTSQPSADGKKMVDGFFITVNTPSGPRDLSDMSGGEEVILDQVIYDAVGDLLRRMSGLNLQTAIKDEADGPLDPERAGKYLHAIQAYLQISGLHQVLMISHRPEIQEQIPQRLVLVPGRGVIAEVA